MEERPALPGLVRRVIQPIRAAGRRNAAAASTSRNSGRGWPPSQAVATRLAWVAEPWTGATLLVLILPDVFDAPGDLAQRHRDTEGRRREIRFVEPYDFVTYSGSCGCLLCVHCASVRDPFVRPATM